MKIFNWTEIEENILIKDMKKKSPEKDTVTLIYFLLLLTSVVFLFSCPKIFSHEPIQYSSQPNGAFWTCKRCRTSQWSNQTDWRGDYYCSKCGVKMGQE